MDLVTGGAGFIGSHLVTALVRQGRPVRVLDNLSTGRLELLDEVKDAIDFVEADITDPAATEEAMRGVERVFHQAALRSVPRSVDDPLATDRVNVGGTLTVLVAARNAKVRRVVCASSSSVYGDAVALPLREDAEPRPVSPYAVSKAAGEQYARVFTRLYGLPTVSLRYFNVFGPGQSPDSEYAAVIPKFLAAALARESIAVHGDGAQSRDFTYIDNVVLANCLAAEAPAAAGQVFNVACGAACSLLDILHAIAGDLGVDGVPVRWHHTPARAGDVRHTLADVSRARDVLGYAPVVAFREGLRRTLAAVRETAPASRPG